MLISAQDFIQRLAESKGYLRTVENRIVLGDCLMVLRSIPTDSVDLIHTSPPYNIDKAYKGNHDDRQDLEAYGDFIGQVIIEMKRILAPNGCLFWQTGYTQIKNGVSGNIVPLDMLSYHFFVEEPCPLVLWDRIIWRYFAGMAFKRKFTNRHETILWFVKPAQGQANPHFDVDAIREKSRELDKRNNFWGRNPGNVWEVDRVAYGSTEQSSHIAVYPEEVAEKIIRATSRVGALVLDPFSGSGTTPKVARSLARRWLGIEISEEYARESVRRIGFQQPSELESLVSAVVKAKVFGGRPGCLPVHEIASRLTAWARAVDVSTSRECLQSALSRVFNAPDGKDAKPEVWGSFERLIHGSSNDPVVESDGLLAADYKNRRNLNGVFRYRTALETLEALLSLVLRASDSSLCAFLEGLAANEPSSYTLAGDRVSLLHVEKRLKPPTRTAELETACLQGVLDMPPSTEHPVQTPMPDQGAESYQRRFPM